MHFNHDRLAVIASSSAEYLRVPASPAPAGSHQRSSTGAITALCVVFLLATAPEYVHAGSLGKAAARAAQKRIVGTFTSARATAPKMSEAARVGTPPAAVAGKPRDVIIQRSRHPETAAHIEHAQRAGQPTVLTLDRAGASQRRKEALSNIRRKESSPKAKDRDEYPPAMARSGGFNANVRYIEAKDNRGAGKVFQNQVRDLPDGARVRVIVTD